MILVAGSSNLDFVVRASRIPRPGETVLGEGFRTFPGGKGANQAVACARAGGAVTHLLTALGADAFAQPIETSLHDAQVQLHVIRSDSEPTGCAFICVSSDGENAISVAPGANATLLPGHLPPLSGFSHLLLQLETPLSTVLAYAQAARSQGLSVVLNAAPAQSLPADLLEKVDILVVNEGELAAVTRHEGSIAQCLERIQVPIIVVTLGAKGCCARGPDQLFFQPAYAVKPVDTTAAGDTFCGVLVAALSRGADLAQALRTASAAGALACTIQGAQSSIPRSSDVMDFLAQQVADIAESTRTLRAFCGFP